MISNTLTSLLLLASRDQRRCFKSLSFSPHPFFFLLHQMHPNHKSILFLSASASDICPLFSLPHAPLLFFSLNLSLLHILLSPLLTPTFQFSCALALCSPFSQPPLSWRQSISQVHGARTRCRLVTDSMSCRGLHIGQKCCMSTPPGMITAKIEPPQPISESWGVCNTIRPKCVIP